MTSFTGIVYKITNDEDLKNCQADEFVWGINKEFARLPADIVDKINNGLHKIKEPWCKGIPYSNDGIFVFKSKKAIQTFLFNICNLTYDEINQFKNFGYILHEYHVECIGSGYSNLRGVVFEDEIVSDNIIDFNDLCDEFESLLVNTQKIPESQDCKLRFYNNKFKIYYK